MQLEDIVEEKETLWGKLTKGRGSKAENSYPPSISVPVPTNNVTSEANTKSDTPPRRGSHLLAAAGIDLEKRRKRGASTTNESRIYNEGGEWLEEKDGKITKLEIVEVNEKMGRMRRAVPTLSVPIALLLCCLNLLLPGAGTFIGAATLLCGAKCHHERVSDGIKYGIFAGVIQVLLAPLLVGWIFSIYYGVNIVHDSMTKAAVKPEEPVVEDEPEKPSSKDQLTVQAWA